MNDSKENLLKVTPLHGAHKALGARMVPFGGWDMPLSYKGQLDEHKAVRNNVGIFDVSHMGQVRIQGEDSLEYLQRLVPGDFSKLEDGKGKYTQLCNDEGGIIDDLIITQLSQSEYFAVVNASTRENDVKWMTEAIEILGLKNVSIQDESEDWAMIAIQGPTALEFLEVALPGMAWSQTPAFTMHEIDVDGKSHYFSRTGYTGETGGELICPVDMANHWWDKFLKQGAVPCGLAARDSLRLEAGYCLYGNDLDLETTPVEASLSWSVSWKKDENYFGRSVLEKQKENGAAKRLIALKCSTRRPPRTHDPVLFDGEKVGEVTSGGFSPQLNTGIAMAYVDGNSWKQESYQVESRGKAQDACRIKPPFVSTSLK